MPPLPGTSTTAQPRFGASDSDDEIGDPVVLSGPTHSNSPGAHAHASSRHGQHEASHLPANEPGPSSTIVLDDEARILGAVAGGLSSSDEENSEIAAEASASAKAAKKRHERKQNRAASESAEPKARHSRSSDRDSSGFNWAGEVGPFAIFTALAAAGLLLTRFLRKRKDDRYDAARREEKKDLNVESATVHLPGLSAISDKFLLPISKQASTGYADEAGPSDTTFAWASV